MSGQDPAGRSMKDLTENFFQEFFSKGEVLVKDLIEENERLRNAASAVTEAAHTLPSAGAAVPANMVERLVQRVARLEQECGEIRRIAGNVKQETGGFRGRLDTLEREHYQLAAMYVAANQFHSAATIDDVVRTITEILLNFIGIGKFTLFCVDEARQTLFPISREGGDVAQCEELELSAPGPIADVTRQRSPWRSGDPTGEVPGVLVHLPLVSGTRLVGLARLESFLPQKHQFEETDQGLLELVSEHSGISIETAWIRAHAKDEPFQRSAIENLVGA